MGCDVLNLEWSSSGRDREVASLICFALRQKGYHVVEESIFKYQYNLLKYKPRLLYVADPKGAQINYKAIRFANNLGIPAVSFTAEGNYTDDLAERMFWGHIDERQLLEALNVQWSAKDRDIVLKIDPNLKKKVKVGGAVGFDRYKILRFYSKSDLMQKYRLSFQNVIGYASWSFDRFYREDRWTTFWQEHYGEDRYARFREDRIEINDFLSRLIQSFPSTLFLIKEHPGVIDASKTEFVGLAKYPNVLIIKNEETIADCINACDIWLAFESTTALEAWLLNKPTIFINPTEGDFPRTEIARGCLVVSTYEQLQEFIDEYQANGIISEFEDKEFERQNIIENIIQWGDGKNHMRVALLFEEILREVAVPNYSMSVSQQLRAYWQYLQFRFGPFLPFIPRFRRSANFSYSELNHRKSRYEFDLVQFHKNNPLTAQDIKELQMINDDCSEFISKSLRAPRKEIH